LFLGWHAPSVCHPRNFFLDSLQGVSILSDFWRLFSLVRPYAGRLFVGLTAMLVATALNLVLPLAIQAMVDTVFVERSSELLNQVALLVLGLYIVRALVTVVESYNLFYVGERLVADLRAQVYAHTIQLSLRFFADRRLGEVTSRLTSDIVTMQAAVVSTLATLLNAVLTIAGALVIVFRLNWRLTLMVLALVPAAAILSRLSGRLVRRFSRELQDRLADATAVLEETLGGIRIVKSFARERYERARYQQAVEQVFEVAKRRAQFQALISPAVGLIFMAGLSAVLWFGGREVLAGRLTAGELIAFLFYSMTIAGAVSALVNSYSSIQQGLGASERIFELLDTPSDIVERPNAEVLAAVTGAVAFENVSFNYQDEQGVLREIDLTIQPGEVVALVGPSGAGKSTLVNLVPRFYDVSCGRITIDGHDIRDVTLESLRTHIAVVPQETLLFSTSVRDNIRYGRLEASDAEIEAAALAAHAHEWILRLPQGYDTLVGEKGVKLSGGQRQRVAIARALLKNPAILLLDEATSALDSESEGIVQAALERLMQGRTVFVIAHRLSTIRRADRIVVLDEGRIVEQGSHQELLAHEGLYARLYRLQFRESAPAVAPPEPALNGVMAGRDAEYQHPAPF
jgi:subfamily B ATP-binding cassette protein MsbA